METDTDRPGFFILCGEHTNKGVDMATRIRIAEDVFTLHWRQDPMAWTGEGPTAEQMVPRLNRQLAWFSPSGADPNPPSTFAEEMAELFGGEVIEVDEVPFDPDVVY